MDVLSITALVIRQVFVRLISDHFRIIRFRNIETH